MEDNIVGIYFGIKGIEVTWVKSGKIIDSFDISAEKYVASELEEKIPQKTKIIALIKEGLRKREIESFKAGICLAGRELIIRSFELPLNIPSRELPLAVSYEAKKYLPFKLEDIIFDFRTKKEYKEKKLLVTFLGIKRDNFDFYSSIIKEIGFKLINVEYAGFSLLRFTKALNLGKKGGAIGVLALDVEDETAFVVLEDTFPLFARDIYLERESDESSWRQKLKSEIQLSLDYYYHRKFPSKYIDKIVIFGTPSIKDGCLKLSQEVDWILEFVDISNITQSYRYNLSSLKSLGVSIAVPRARTPYEFNLLEIWEREEKQKEKKEIPHEISPQKLRPSIGIIIFSIFVIFFVFISQYYKANPIKKEIDRVLSERTKIHTLFIDKSIEELENKKSDYENKISAITKIINKYSYFTPSLNLLPNIIPQGVWLTELKFAQKETDRELILKGRAYLGDYNKEVEAINKFFSSLKNNLELLKIYKDIELVSIERSEIEKEPITNFIISCR